jgi:ribonuclease HII
MYNFENEFMCRLENDALTRGFKTIAGIDEAGRGALAGPVVAACVVLDPHNIPNGIVDSKKISDRKRRSLFELISRTAVSTGIGAISPSVIDEINIFNATKLAMKAAVDNSAIKPDFLLIDAVKLYDISISSLSVIKGEEKSVSVAAASIFAKVYRDDIMIALSKQFPDYGFSSHKGYPTALHRKMLLKYGPLVIHRNSYRPVGEACDLWKLKNQN